MSGHSRNPIFFNKKKTGHPEGSTTPLPPALTSDNISLLPEPPTPLKMDVICISPLKVEQFHPSPSTRRTQLSVAAKIVRSTDLLNCNVKT